MLFAVVSKSLVNLVGNNVNIRISFEHLGKFFQLLARIKRTRGVVGSVDNDSLGLVGNRRLNRVYVQSKTVVGGHRDYYGRTAADFYQFRISKPIGSNDDDFVALFNRDLNGVKQTLLCAAADYDLILSVSKIVVACEFFAYGVL